MPGGRLRRWPVRYHEPGQMPIELPGSDARVFVLGPPRDKEPTLRTPGLEMMAALELALVPTDSKTAGKVNWGTLPWTPLLGALAQKTKNRVIRTDANLPGPISGFAVRESKLYYEVEL